MSTCGVDDRILPGVSTVNNGHEFRAFLPQKPYAGAKSGQAASIRIVPRSH
jgi:hypothetical protein